MAQYTSKLYNCYHIIIVKIFGHIISGSPRFLCHPMAFFSTCCSRGTSESSTYGKQRIFPPTLDQHISTFRGYLILFSIRNPYINRFTNHFSIKVVLHSITARFSLKPYDFIISHLFWNICHVTSRKL